MSQSVDLNYKIWGWKARLVVVGGFICLIFIFNNRIFYGVVSILFFIFFSVGILYGLLGVVLAPLVFASKDSKDLRRKYYKIAWTVKYFVFCASPFLKIYLAVILLKLSFLYPTQRVVVVVAQPVPAQKQRKEVSEGNSGPTKTGDSGNSGNSGAEE
ncbi:hypothetical protein CAEBREN_08639 [Caenorhabditis brenneri]|uniref:Uncharacterized protein n=1 Tax=Caenorhabditis brenneri TaxID=135651 RepID=G0N2A0_CAEBE|nr:hypothetical protein CAEBREN_08639 [Caenorhabditis brenneri]